jgi:2'-5' RNA ligase
MPYAITLLLNNEAAAPVKRMWHILANLSGDDDALRLGYGPHLTLAILPDPVALKDIETAIAGLTENWEALPIVLSGLGVFPVSPPVVWLAPVVTCELLARHRSLLAALASLPVDPHYSLGAWMPHVTLTESRKSSPAQALEAAMSVWSGPINGAVDRCDLVRLHPVEIVRSETLRPADRSAGGPQSGGAFRYEQAI